MFMFVTKTILDWNQETIILTTWVSQEHVLFPGLTQKNTGLNVTPKYRIILVHHHQFLLKLFHCNIYPQSKYCQSRIWPNSSSINHKLIDEIMATYAAVGTQVCATCQYLSTGKNGMTHAVRYTSGYMSIRKM